MRVRACTTSACTPSGMLIGSFVKIFDRRFIDQGADAAVSHLYRVGVVPLDGALDLVAVLQHEDHEGLGVHLLLQIESFRMRAFSPSIRSRLLLMGHQESIAREKGPTAPHPGGKSRPDQL